jgi:serum/glucocorticoid-regulated kinase 2
MLNKHGKNTPLPEIVKFSDFVVKINKKEKEQTRALLITDKAIYNLLPNNYTKCKRRIPLDEVGAVTLSQVSEEFVLHVPSEYDYRFKSLKKEKVATAIQTLFNALMEKSGDKRRLAVKKLVQSDLKAEALSKAQARLQSREEVLRRKKELMEIKHESDDEEVEGEEKGKLLPAIEGSGGGDQKVKLEDFELLKVLGRGAFGKVMQVKKKSDGKIYALKILKKRAIIARNQVEHTKAERKILQSLQHPYLMTLRYAFQSKEKLYFVLDYLRGGELFFHLKKNRRFPEDIAKLWVGEIALALGHLHALDTVYRDLKPENVLLDDDGHVCLTDFGLAKDVAPQDKAHTFAGTPEYLAPEIVTGVGHDKAVDWWALGILLYELTVGIPPFYSQNVNEMYNLIQHGVLRFPPFLSEPCKGIIVGFLNRDPRKRLGSAADVEDVKAHPFFRDLNFEKLYRKEIPSKYKPELKGEEDSSNFDKEFTSEPVVDSVVAPSAIGASLAPHEKAFDGFTYDERARPAHLG